MNQFVAVGGHSEGPLGLGPVHESISRNQELVEAAAEITADELDMSLQSVWTVYEAINNPFEFAKAIDGKVVAAHSIGNSAVLPGMTPEALASFGPPEPGSNTAKLVMNASTKTLHHVRNALLPGGEHRKQSARVFASGAYQLTRHPIHNWNLLRESTRFSTQANNLNLEKEGISTAIIASGMDEYFNPSVYLKDSGAEKTGSDTSPYLRIVLGARHDDFLIDPEGFTAPEMLRFLDAIN